MRKIIGKEGIETGEFNVMRLAEELKDIEIGSFMIDPESGEITLVFADELETQISIICDMHLPNPLLIPLNDIEQIQIGLAETIEKQEMNKVEQQLAQAEILETILRMIDPQGGGI